MVFFNTYFPNTQVVFAIMDQAGQMNHSASIQPMDSELFHEKLEQIQNEYVNAIITVDRNLKTLKKHACVSVANQDWYVSEKGVIETCMRSSHSNKNIFAIGFFDENKSNFTLIPEKIQALEQFDIDQQEDCRICFAKYLCGRRMSLFKKKW